VQQVAAWTHARIARVLRAHGRSLDGLGDDPPELTHDQPVLASCYAASAADLQLLGDTAGQRTLERSATQGPGCSADYKTTRIASASSKISTRTRRRAR